MHRRGALNPQLLPSLLGLTAVALLAAWLVPDTEPTDEIPVEEYVLRPPPASEPFEPVVHTAPIRTLADFVGRYDGDGGCVLHVDTTAQLHGCKHGRGTLSARADGSFGVGDERWRLDINDDLELLDADGAHRATFHRRGTGGTER